MQSGDLCIVEFPFEVSYIDSLHNSIVYSLDQGEIFVLLSLSELDELGVLEVQILFENKKMWFNIHKNDSNIEYVRRAKSYDIPFVTIQEVEPGSNSSSLVETYSPTHPQLRATSHIFNLLKF